MIKRGMVAAVALTFVGVPAGVAAAQTFGADIMPDLWLKVQAAGPFATMIMIYLWTKSETERRKLQDERNELLERVLTAMNNSSQAMRDVRIGLFGGAQSHHEE